nr:MAG TPA: hypothetical protein [Caudoviricetes sp.]
MVFGKTTCITARCCKSCIDCGVREQSHPSRSANVYVGVFAIR